MVDGPPQALSGRERLDEIVREHLAPDLAERWMALARPAVRLTPVRHGEAVLARLGGRPLVPAGFEWPVWEGHGPLSFVAELDLEALGRSGLEHGLRLPRTGRLLFFYFDGSFDDFAGVVGTWEKESLAGARVIRVRSEEGPSEERAAPQGVLEFESKELGGRSILTFPGWEHPALRREFQTPGMDDREWLDHPVNADAFTEAVWELFNDPGRHQVGGWGDPVQGPIEFEVAQAALETPFEYGDQTHTAEALQWRLLLQVDSDDDVAMMWGDVGMLYWMCRDGAQEQDGAEQTSFTWQCL